MEHKLKKLVTDYKHETVGIYSCCSANEFVIEAALERAKETNTPLLIEATANQVDQYGGYTGMTPQDFMAFVKRKAMETGVDMQNVYLGGDHLGPLTFTEYDEDKAMSEASELIRQYVLAGFTKIHVDTSMKVNSDDKDIRLSDEIIAQRAAKLVSVATEAYKERLKEVPDAIAPVYVIGSEVPIPGGSQAAVDNGVEVTKVADLDHTVKAFREAFEDNGLMEVYDNVIAIVVQPGVEEKDSGCTEYDRQKAKELMAAIDNYPNLVYEGHSTDYQTKIKLKEMVEDGVKILKVGPALTFAMREGLFALYNIEKELYKNTDVKTSHLLEVLDEKMIEEPKYWSKHYHGSSNEIALKRKYSFSDRCRYYMPLKDVENAINVMFDNLKDGCPLNLLSQFMPLQYTKVREGYLNNDPRSLVKDRIKNCIDEYLFATNQNKLL